MRTLLLALLCGLLGATQATALASAQSPFALAQAPLALAQAPLTLAQAPLTSAQTPDSLRYPKREFRGAWFPTVTNRTWKTMTQAQIRADILATLDSLAAVHCNAVLFQVRPQADAFFPSDLEPWSRFITGEQGKAPDPLWDPTAFVIEACHERCMEMHAWINPYRVTSNEEEVLAEDHLFHKRPDLFVKYGKQRYFNPGEPQARAHVVQVIADLVRRYDVDAVHFDDYFYPYRIDGEEFPDEATFQKYREADVFAPEDKENWRRHNVNRMVQTLNDTIKSIKPWVKFGISPFGVWRNAADDVLGSPTQAGQTNYDDLYADVRLWCKEGWIDYNVPQLYWIIGHPLADYEPLIHWWSANSFGVNLYIGQSLGAILDAKMPDGTTQDQLYRKMQLVREDSLVHGNVWWPGTGLVRSPRMMDSLRIEYQRYPALVPQYTTLDTVPPAPVCALQVSNGVLTWQPTPAELPLDETVYYGIYRVEGPNRDLSGNTSSCRLVAVVRHPSYTLPQADIDNTGEVRYAVTALDRMQNESSPQWIDL